jgi:hypothetical protein
MLSLERCAAILRNNDCRMDNGTLKELRDYLYQLASIQVMNESDEADINPITNHEPIDLK